MTKLLAVLVLFLYMGCEEEFTPPQIHSTINAINIGVEVIDPARPAKDFDIQIINRGEMRLTVSSVNLRGDTNCSFYFVDTDETEEADWIQASSRVLKNLDKTKLYRNESGFIRVWYRPGARAEDHVVLEITSDSEDNSLLTIPICGKGILEGDDNTGIPPCSIPPSNQADCATR